MQIRQDHLIGKTISDTRAEYNDYITVYFTDCTYFQCRRRDWRYSTEIGTCDYCPSRMTVTLDQNKTITMITYG